MTGFDEDSQAGLPPAGLGGVPLELARGRHATGAGPNPPASRGPVPGGVAPGTTAPPNGDPPRQGGAAQSPEGAARLRTAAAPSGSTRPRRPRPVFVAMLRRAVHRCRDCNAPAPDHLVNCRRSGELLRTGRW